MELFLHDVQCILFLSVNSIYVNLAVIMFSIYYFSEVEELNRVIEKQLRKKGRIFKGQEKSCQ